MTLSLKKYDTLSSDDKWLTFCIIFSRSFLITESQESWGRLVVDRSKSYIKGPPQSDVGKDRVNSLSAWRALPDQTQSGRRSRRLT